jgi:hypothetical protein
MRQWTEQFGDAAQPLTECYKAAELFCLRDDFRVASDGNRGLEAPSVDLG